MEKEKDEEEFEIEAIVPKFVSREIAVTVEKLSWLAKFLYYTATIKDKSSLLVKDCIKDYIYTE
jgi:hypothetical protein